MNQPPVPQHPAHQHPPEVPHYGYPPPPQVKTNGFAVAGLVLGIIPVFGGILGIIFGSVAIDQINKANGWQGGKGMAIAGLVCGIVWLSLTLIGIATGPYGY